MPPSAGRVIDLCITSNVVCPWCYIATLELRKAIARAYTNHLPLRFHIEYKPFEFQGVPSCMNDEAREGFQKRATGIYPTLSDRAKQFGVKLRGPTNEAWRSISASRLLLYAYRSGGQDAQQALLTELFRAYHDNAEDIEDFQVLAQCCEQASIMSREETFMFLESNSLLDDVEQTIDLGWSLGISRIPLIVINNKWSLVGAQSSDVYYQIFSRLSQGKDL